MTHPPFSPGFSKPTRHTGPVAEQVSKRMISSFLVIRRSQPTSSLVPSFCPDFVDRRCHSVSRSGGTANLAGTVTLTNIENLKMVMTRRVRKTYRGLVSPQELARGLPSLSHHQHVRQPHVPLAVDPRRLRRPRLRRRPLGFYLLWCRPPQEDRPSLSCTSSSRATSSTASRASPARKDLEKLLISRFSASTQLHIICRVHCKFL